MNNNDFEYEFWKDHVCGDCKHCYMWYDNLDWECFGCDFGQKKIDDPSDEACPYIELREEH